MLRGSETTATSYGGARSIVPLQDPRGSVEAPPQLEGSFRRCYSSAESYAHRRSDTMLEYGLTVIVVENRGDEDGKRNVYFYLSEAYSQQ
nr:hypothetical protein Iba_chr15cCG6330 [Ipomoea batatas]